MERASDADIRRAAEIAGLAADIEGFPAGYQTIVGERGITLSGGQKHRTAIARAILRDPRILVLDDALSSVDTLTEERILTHLSAVMRGRTVILISHRVSTVRQADRIVVLEKGRIVERNTRGVGRSGRLLCGPVPEADAGRRAGSDLARALSLGAVSGWFRDAVLGILSAGFLDGKGISQQLCLTRLPSRRRGPILRVADLYGQSLPVMGPG